MAAKTQNNESLMALYVKHDGKVSDKWASYLEVYDRQLSVYRDKPICMLEIGIQNGGSLEIWAKYFPMHAAIIGCDIDEKCRGLVYSEPNVSIVVGDAMSDEVFAKVNQLSRSFDIIIDDGSHKSRDIIAAFVRYFPLLNDGGIFIAEDLHASYWKSYGGGLGKANSANGFFKRLSDLANDTHWEVDISRADYLGLDQDAKDKLSEDQLMQVQSVFFADSICSVSKAAKLGPEKLGKRIITGTRAEITDDPRGFHGTYCPQKIEKKRKMSMLGRLLNR